MYNWFWLVITFFLVACNGTNQRLIITGHVPESIADGEAIYLVPLKGANSESVDSMIVVDGIFQTEKQIQQPEIVIIRTRPQLRLVLQELLIVLEPGAVEVSLNKESSAGGTPLNNALQQWKEKKTDFDETRRLLYQMLQTEDSSSKDEIDKRMNKLVTDYTTYCYDLIRSNRENLVGRFVYAQTKNLFSAEQLEELNISE